MVFHQYNILDDGYEHNNVIDTPTMNGLNKHQPLIKNNVTIGTSIVKEMTLREEDKFVENRVENSRQEQQTNLMTPMTTTTTATTSRKMERERTTAIAFIAMGPASKSKIPQRCIRSLRKRGNWNGPIMILTDLQEQQKGKGNDISFSRYKELLESFDDNVYVIQAKEDDLKPKNGRKLGMSIYKRFKTLLLEYINDIPILSDTIETVVYLDIDIVIGKPFDDFLSFYEESIIQSGLRNNDNKNDSFFSMFATEKDVGYEYVAHSGIMVLERQYAPMCLQEWKNTFDNKKTIERDQILLAKTIARLGRLQQEQQRDGNNGHSTSTASPICTLHKMDVTKHVIFPNKENMKNKRYETFVHITNSKRAWTLPEELQQEYLKDALLIDDTEENEQQLLAGMIGKFE